MNEYQRYGDYTEQSAEREGIGLGGTFAFLLVGIGIGATLALLFTPKSGQELRGHLGRRYRNTMEGVTQRTKDLRERGSNLLGFNKEPEERQYGRG